MHKRIKPIVVILIIAVVLLTMSGSVIANEIINRADEYEKDIKPDIEVEETLIIDDPPFISILKTKLFYYDYRYVNLQTGEEGDYGYIARNFAVYCHYNTTATPEGGSFTTRRIEDYSTNKMYRTSIMPGVYNYTTRQPMARWGGFWSKMIDYSEWKAIDTGIEELMEETLQYIDYSVPSGRITRCYLKDGDIYAMWVVSHRDGSSANTVTYVSNATGDPSDDIFSQPQKWEDIHFPAN